MNSVLAPRATVLVLGESGHLGSEVVCAPTASRDVAARTRTTLECSDVDAVASFVQRVRTALVINAAGYTRGDDAESDRDAAGRLNAEMPRVLAASCQAIGAGGVHLSSHYVFSDNGSEPYRGDDPTAPLHWYGEIKLIGEEYAKAACERAFVIRISWIDGRTGQNFFGTMLRLPLRRSEIRVVDDQWCAPTWSRAVAQGLAAMATSLQVDLREWVERRGVYHLAASGTTTWCRFANRLLERDPQRPDHAVGQLIPISSDEYPTPARRPSFSALNCDRLDASFGIRLPDWQEQLAMGWNS